MSVLSGPVVGSRRFARIRSFGGSWMLAGSVVVMLACVLAAALAPLLTSYDPNLPELGNALAPPGGAHLLGTDQSGRDTFARLAFGARTSLVGPLAVVVASTVGGVLLGLVAGWRGGWVDAALSRVFDILFAFPALLVAILAVSLFGKGLVAPVLAMAIAYTPFIARQVRGLVVSVRTRPFVAAYLTQGFGPVHVGLRVVVPSIAPAVLAQATVMFGYALLDLAALSFLGLGVQPPTADWGAMIDESRGAVLLGQPLTAVLPSLAVILAVVAFNVVGEELGDRIARRDA
ncbi:MAG: ABC-type transporter integral rane subunit [Nocardioidaceae bacterium]|nr:ABC-type transporter integral rane subunit [Nocardioidaceae bacterium]